MPGEKGNPIRIGSAADLIAALAEPNPMVRLGILHRIAQNPTKALSYGTYNGVDVLDALMALTPTVPVGQLRHAHIVTLANFRDRRAIEFLMRDLPSNHDTQSVIAIIVRLGEETTEAVRHLLVEMLSRDALSAHARTSANVLAFWPDWEPDVATRLRISLLSDGGGMPPPAFDDDTADLWLAQLRGATARRAWEFLEMQGLAAFSGVGLRWEKLDDVQRLALLQWGGRCHLDQVGGLLRATLASSDEPLLLESLRLLAQLPAQQALHQPRLRELWRHPSLEVRCAVLRAGLSELEWLQAIADATELPLQRELITAYARACREESLPFVLDALQSSKWQIRSTATQLAIEAGEAAIEGARALTHHERPEVRLAACQVLIELGQQTWLEETFL